MRQRLQCPRIRNFVGQSLPAIWEALMSSRQTLVAKAALWREVFKKIKYQIVRGLIMVRKKMSQKISQNVQLSELKIYFYNSNALEIDK